MRRRWKTWRCSPVLQLRRAPIIGEPCSDYRRTVLSFLENRAPVSRIITKEVEVGYVPYWRDTLLSTRWLKSDWKASEGEKQAYICWCFNKDIHCMFVEGSQELSFFLQTLLFTAFVVTVQKIITYALVQLWAHDPGSAQDGSMSHDLCTTAVPYLNVFWLNSCSPQPLLFDVNDLMGKINRNGMPQPPHL